MASAFKFRASVVCNVAIPLPFGGSRVLKIVVTGRIPDSEWRGFASVTVLGS